MAEPFVRRCARLAALAGVLAFAACAQAGRTLPPGVIDPGPAHAKVGGIYPGPPGDPSCCWADRDVDVMVEKRDAADDFALHVYLPDVPSVRAHPQGYALTLDGRSTETRCCFGPGLHTVLFRVPAALRARTGPVRVQVRASTAFVPSREGLGPDDRELSFVLVSMSFRSYFRGRF